VKIIPDRIADRTSLTVRLGGGGVVEGNRYFIFPGRENFLPKVSGTPPSRLYPPRRGLVHFAPATCGSHGVPHAHVDFFPVAVQTALARSRVILSAPPPLPQYPRRPQQNSFYSAPAWLPSGLPALPVTMFLRIPTFRQAPENSRSPPLAPPPVIWKSPAWAWAPRLNRKILAPRGAKPVRSFLQLPTKKCWSPPSGWGPTRRFCASLFLKGKSSPNPPSPPWP